MVVALALRLVELWGKLLVGKLDGTKVESMGIM